MDQVKSPSKQRYQDVKPQLIERHGYGNVMAVPRIEKVVINMGLGEAREDSKVMERASREMAQIALRFGANDFGSLMIEENVVSATGIDFIMPESEIVRLIEDAGFTPRRRYQDYTLATDGDDGCPCCARRMTIQVEG